MTTVDELAESEKVCLIHLDVEGFEYQALSGSRQVLETQKPPVIVEHRHGQKDKIKPFLKKLSYHEKWQAEFNILFIHEKDTIFQAEGLKI